MDLRLEKRYDQLVKSHMQAGNKLASGIKNMLSKDAALNQTQAAWRFFNNENCTLNELSAPLLKAAHELSEQECDEYILLAHDWSYLSYSGHKSKKDTYNTIKSAVGYDLQTSLMLSNRHGGPLSPVAMNLKTKSLTFSSYGDQLKGLTHLEELTKRISWLELQGFKKPLVHIIDREADSIAFLRSLSDKNWLIRCNGSNYATVGSEKKKLEEIAKDLTYLESRTINYKGKSANQQISEVVVTITRDACPKRKGPNGKRLPTVKGFPVKAYLIVSRIVDANGKELAIWYLLSNITGVLGTTLALWYYWRWSIETFFKLLKSAGMQLESWQQTSGVAIARRLLVGSMACVCVWRIAHAKGAEASELRKILVRLSGRQMKWKKEFTYNALLAGLESFLSIQDFLENNSVDELKSLISQALGDKRLM